MSFLILMILVAVAAIDWISGKIRFAIIGQRSRSRQVFSTKTRRASAAKRERFVTSGLSSVSTSVLSTTVRIGRPSVIESRAASVASTSGGGSGWARR